MSNTRQSHSYRRSVQEAYLHVIPTNPDDVLPFRVVADHGAPAGFMEALRPGDGVDNLHEAGQELLDDLPLRVLLQLPCDDFGQGCVDRGEGFALEVDVDLVL